MRFHTSFSLSAPRLLFCDGASLFLLLFLSTLCAADRPNVIIFMMDDMGYGDCRTYNPESQAPMPNLEKLAQQGMQFTDAHSPSAVCAPTRYSVLTGNYPWRGRNEKVLHFIDQHCARHAAKPKPFFIHYCSQACHVPHSPPEELDGTPIKGVTGDPHLDMLVEADVTLGKIIERLEANGELTNTLILFTSDNGGLSRGRFSKEGPKGGHDSCAGLRGSKAQIYEGGHRVPLIARWDGRIPGGTTSDALIGLQDLYATLAQLTGQEIDPGQGLDSRSFLATLTGTPNAPVRRSLFVQANNEDNTGQRLMKMVREGHWKLIATKDLQHGQLHFPHLRILTPSEFILTF